MIELAKVTVEVSVASRGAENPLSYLFPLAET